MLQLSFAKAPSRHSLEHLQVLIAGTGRSAQGMEVQVGQ